MAEINETIPTYNDEIKKQLEEMICIPAVLMSRQEEPYEYREVEGSKARFKRKRSLENLPFQLYNFAVQNNIQKNQLREFASGLFLNYIDTCSIYM